MVAAKLAAGKWQKKRRASKRTPIAFALFRLCTVTQGYRFGYVSDMYSRLFQAGFDTYQIAFLI